MFAAFKDPMKIVWMVCTWPCSCAKMMEAELWDHLLGHLLTLYLNLHQIATPRKKRNLMSPHDFHMLDLPIGTFTKRMICNKWDIHETHGSMSLMNSASLWLQYPYVSLSSKESSWNSISGPGRSVGPPDAAGERSLGHGKGLQSCTASCLDFRGSTKWGPLDS